ncbi:MAG: GNAT family N-acetyltransferase [Burkholderiales bacterium]
MDSTDPRKTPKRPGEDARHRARDGTGAAHGHAAPLALTVHDDLAAVDAAAWDALLQASPAPTPFMRHAYLQALHRSGSATADTGWSPLACTLTDPHGTLQAACMLYLKTHSYGEYVFDWAWADAFERAGHRYYPKLLGAVPFTPVPGSRLLARSDEARRGLLRGIETLMQQSRLSSAHLLFVDDAERQAAHDAGWLLREGVQFHWENRPTADGAVPYADFADFLASLTRDKRKKIQQERRYVREAGIRFEALPGPAITEAQWDFFHRCYVRTYREHHSTPYLTRAFFTAMARDMPEHWLLMLAYQGDVPVAASLLALDPAQRVAYGRYWGAVAEVPHLHFAACYYEPLDWCIRHQWQRFEGGAQGEHKMARGLLPVRTWSAHKLAHPAFNDAVARFLEHEEAGIEAYLGELDGRSPFKRTP